MENSDFKEMFDLYRKQLEHEDSLVNARITWYLLIQGALGAFYTFIAKDFLGNRAQIPNSIRLYLALLIFSGLFLTMYTLISVIAATKASDNLAVQCDKVLQEWRRWQVVKSSQDPLYRKLPLPNFPRGGGKVVWHRIGFWFGPWGFLALGLLWLYLLYDYFATVQVVFPVLLRGIGILATFLSMGSMFFEFKNKASIRRVMALGIPFLSGCVLILQNWKFAISLGVYVLSFAIYDFVCSRFTFQGK